jgi:glucarate dehydratase
MSAPHRITRVVVTPIAFRDPPLLNSWGVHEPLALRSIVRLEAGDVVAYGEGSGELEFLEALRTLAPLLTGMSPFEVNRLRRLVEATVPASRPYVREVAFSILEVAFLDAQGRLTGTPVVDLLGGRARDRVPFSGYLFYKWSAHRTPAGEELAPDEWGAALDPAGLVAEATRMIDRYGFRSLKLKAGVFAPEVEAETMRALAAAFPGHPLRIDPNGAWTVPTALNVARELDGVLEYLEDPVLGVEAMAEVARQAPMPLATNMCVTRFDEIPRAVAAQPVSIVLVDHHNWGGLRRSQELARVCETFGWGVSMHSNSHLGISLAAMTHLAAAVPHLSYACDTHYPWNAADDIVRPGAFAFQDGSVEVSDRPGLGVEVDEDALAALHEQYVASGRTARDDTRYARLVDPSYDPTLPRF